VFERECVSVYVRGTEKERERERVSECVCESVCVWVCVSVCLCVSGIEKERELVCV